MIFRDRRAAGRSLALLLSEHRGAPGLLVLALPRGGVPVGFEVARALDAPLDVFVVRKIGVPGNEELAMGAIASGGIRVLSPDLIRMRGVTPEALEEAAGREGAELARRERAYRGIRPACDISHRRVIVVDDGMATGSTMRAAVIAIRSAGPARVIVAAPVASEEASAALKAIADECVCALRPPAFASVGAWYEDFRQTTDEEVRELLQAAGSAAGS